MKMLKQKNIHIVSSTFCHFAKIVFVVLYEMLAYRVLVELHAEVKRKSTRSTLQMNEVSYRMRNETKIDK